MMLTGTGANLGYKDNGKGKLTIAWGADGTPVGRAQRHDLADPLEGAPAGPYNWKPWTCPKEASGSVGLAPGGAANKEKYISILIVAR